MSADICIGLMSGTSLDGVDAVAAAFGRDGQPFQRLAHHHLPYPDTLKQQLLALNTPGQDEIHHAALAANAVSGCYATVVAELLAHSGLSPREVAALGAHGQTVRHRPGAFDGTGYTVQLLNGALLAEVSGIDVVCDFRSRDVAAGGQGAPLVPAFHQAVFARQGIARGVLNIGGMANLTLLAADGGLSGFDCGPGNVLMDLWCERHRGRPFDEGGAWAAQGEVDHALLHRLLADPFIQMAAPKSTGRDHFNSSWLISLLEQTRPALPAVDVQATLLAYTARAATDALKDSLPDATDLLVCGGGALNARLMQALQGCLPGLPIHSTAEFGLDPMQVEAAAFAWLANAFLARQPAGRPDVTGARGPRLLGALYPA